jgi:class 3 adenylate cyclase
MVGFTELANRVDPEVLQRIIRSYEDACAVCITRYEGYVFQRLGDGIVAFFGYPLAHEGEAERAIRAGLEIIETMSKLDVPDAGHLAVRIGIATGLVVVSSEKGPWRDDESRIPAARHRAARQHRCERAGASVSQRRV